MKELNELKERLIDELKDYGRKDITPNNLEVIDKLAHATKNVCKIIDEGGYSEYYPYDGRSNARRRDNMGRYSSEGYSRHSLTDKLRDLMDEATDDHTRMEIKRLIDKM